jgi:hypothetical protein
MAWTDPKTWSALSVLTASELNQYIRDNLNYLKSIADAVTFSGCQLIKSSAQTLTNATWTHVAAWDSEAFDHGGWHGGSGSGMTTPSGAIPTGITSVLIITFARVKFESNATGNRYVRVIKNGSSFGSASVPGVGGGDTTETILFDATSTVASDDIFLDAYQSSGGSLDITAAQWTILRYQAIA